MGSAATNSHTRRVAAPPVAAYAAARARYAAVAGAADRARLQAIPVQAPDARTEVSSFGGQCLRARDPGVFTCHR
jgi:hypothetical protein